MAEDISQQETIALSNQSVAAHHEQVLSHDHRESDERRELSPKTTQLQVTMNNDKLIQRQPTRVPEPIETLNANSTSKIYNAGTSKCSLFSPDNNTAEERSYDSQTLRQPVLSQPSENHCASADVISGRIFPSEENHSYAATYVDLQIVLIFQRLDLIM